MDKPKSCVFTGYATGKLQSRKNQSELLHKLLPNNYFFTLLHVFIFQVTSGAMSTYLFRPCTFNSKSYNLCLNAFKFISERFLGEICLLEKDRLISYSYFEIIIIHVFIVILLQSFSHVMKRICLPSQVQLQPRTS